MLENEKIRVFRKMHTICLLIAICTDRWSCVSVHVIATKTHIFVDTPCTLSTQMLVPKLDSNLPLALEEKEEEKPLWHESRSVLCFLSFNLLFKTCM